MLALFVTSAHFALFLKSHWFHTHTATNGWAETWALIDSHSLLDEWEQTATPVHEILLTDSCCRCGQVLSHPFLFSCIMFRIDSWKWQLQRRTRILERLSESPWVTQLLGGRSGTPVYTMTFLLCYIKQFIVSRLQLCRNTSVLSLIFTLDCHWSYHYSEQIWSSILSERNLKLINVLTFLPGQNKFSIDFRKVLRISEQWRNHQYKF